MRRGRGGIANMKTLKTLSILSALFLAASMSFGQTILTHTTLSSAVTTSSTTQIPLTSTTGVTATNTILFIADGPGEAMFVNSVPTGGTTVGVTRGYSTLGKARPHASGALVFVIPAGSSGYPPPLGSILPSGSCTRTNVPYLPAITVGVGGAWAQVSDCVGGVWVSGNIAPQGNTEYHIQYPIEGAVTNGAALGTSTATTAAELYCTEIDLPYTKLITGIAPHIGATGGTDLWIGALYDSTGVLVANSAVAGTTPSSSAYAFQALPFTTPYYAVGPAVYFGCVQSNGTTATLDLVKTNFGDYVLTYKSASAGTFGTLPNFTAPTSFGTLKGAWSYLY
jgi:hypothetical protein